MSVTIGEPIRLYAGPAPGSETWEHATRRYHSEIFDTAVVVNVVAPTLTPVLPDRGRGQAVIVAPGGAFHALSIESEGYDVARWLAERGLAAFVLEYRTVQGDDPLVEMAASAGTDPGRSLAAMERVAPLAAMDAATAMRLVRERAGELDVRPGSVGFMGFSAGGNVAMRVAYASDDAVRPAFLAPIYATLRGVELVEPPPGSGPVFVVAATDDPLGLADDAVAIYERWRGAGLPAELHMYAAGGHGFGMRAQHLPSDSWIERFGDWLDATVTQGV